MSNYKPGDWVHVDILKSGYWVNSRVGRFVKDSKSGRVGVKFYNSGSVKYYAPENVSLKS